MDQYPLFALYNFLCKHLSGRSVCCIVLVYNEKYSLAGRVVTPGGRRKNLLWVRSFYYAKAYQCSFQECFGALNCVFMAQISTNQSTVSL